MRFSQAATNVTNAAATIAMLERDAGGAPNIRRMVDRFLAWKLPFDFRPDGGIEFNARYHNGTPEGGEHKPTGTNLLTATQAEAMIRHMLG